MIMTKPKRIILASDISGLGKVAVTAALPLFAVCQLEVSVLPTVLLSSHTGGFPKVYIDDYTIGMQAFLKQWQSLEIGFSALVTGYLKSSQQIASLIDFLERENIPLIVDPIMGDNGKLYNGVTPSTINSMREMLSVADLCFPNYTEACYLTDSEYKVDGVTKEEGIELLKKLRTIGTKSALITSISIDGQSSVIGYSNSSGDYFCLPYNEIPIHFPGTGDIFSAILIGHLLDNESLTNSTQKAIDGVYRLIDLNKENEDKNRGIPLEQYLDIL